MNAAEVAKGMTVQTISETVFLGVVGYRATCSCGWRYGSETEARAVAAAKRHGASKHTKQGE